MNDSTPHETTPEQIAEHMQPIPGQINDDTTPDDIHRAANDLEKDGYAPFARWLRKWAQTNT